MSKSHENKIIAIYGKSYDDDQYDFYNILFSELNTSDFPLLIHQDLWDKISDKSFLSDNIETFSTHQELSEKADYVFSIGGDGTFLNTIPLVKDSGIPVLGFNTGRLGFLSSISKHEIGEAVHAVKHRKYIIDKRKLLCLSSPAGIFSESNFALNEITVHKKDSASMINIHAYVNDIYLNTYWADGLIVATPTGSTAYSLSCGGPIITPDSGNFILTPIAIHNLTVRPVVVPDDSQIRLKIEGRDENYLVSLDSRSVAIEADNELTIVKASFCINILQLAHKNFFGTLREKLMWGIDKRN